MDMSKFLLTISLGFAWLSISAQQLMESAGALKLGTTNLSQEGVIRFTGTDFQGFSNGAWKSFLSGSGSINNWSLNGTSLYNTNSNYIGIGTNSPNAKLHIVGNARTLALEGVDHSFIEFYPDGLSAGRKAYVGIGNASTPHFTIANQENTGGLQFRTQYKDRMFIDKDGFVGIGTTSPTQKLSVEGNIEASGEIISTNSNHFRQVYGNYGVIHRNDGQRYYLMSTLSGDQYGKWNTFRPFAYNFSTGNVSLANNTIYVDRALARVGIGKQAPQHRLDLGSSVGKKLAIYQNSAGSGFYGFGISSGTLEFHASSTAAEDPDMALKNNSDLHIYKSGNILLNQGNTTTVLNSYRSSSAGGVIFQIDPKPENNTTSSNVRLFRSVNSTANHTFAIMKGNNTTQWNHLLSSNGNSYLSKLSGKVVIGGSPSLPGNYKLYVDGGILAEEVKVALSNASDWADDAFDKTPLTKDVKESIETKSHLIDMPSADELVKSGYNLQDMDAKLLQQIEWLWQKVIDLEKQNKALEKKLNKNHE